MRRPLEPGHITAVRRLEGPGRYLFFLDGVTYHEPSRWWIGGDETVSLLISPNGAQQVSIAVRRGAGGGTTTVKVGDLVHTTDMKARRRWDVSADLTGSETFVPVSVGCSGGFRPRDANAESVDARYLGCEVTVRLL